MIDTVVLRLQQNEFQVLDWKRFRKEVFSGKNPYTKYSYIPDTKADGYRPQLTIYDRFGMTANVQFSAPKIIYNGNNFNEVTEADFESLVCKLSLFLGIMAFRVTPDQLKNATVSKIDYCKNIIFTDYTTSSMIISELNKIDISAKLDQTKKDFRNDGHSLTYHANSYEISFYDKRKDLEQAKKYGEKRSIEKDNSAQLPLLDRMAFDPLEVFRIEYRLNQKRVMKQMLEKHGFESDLKFKSLFKKEFSKQLLLGVWQLFDNKFDFTVHNVEDPIKLLDSVFKAKPELSLLKALAYTEAFRIASSGDGGMRRFKEAVEKHSDIRSWHRMKTQLKGVKLSPDRTKLEALIQVGKQLERFEPVNIKDYPQLQDLRCKQ